MRHAAMLMLVFPVVALASCSNRSAAPTPAAALTERPDPLREFAGTWRGTSFSTYAMATVKISFQIRQSGKRFTGDYRCAPGNVVCTNNIQRGWVHGEIAARGFTVAMEDTSWCLFFMNEFYPPSARGEYTCYEGGMVMDRGIFRLQGPASAARQSSSGSRKVDCTANSPN